MNRAFTFFLLLLASVSAKAQFPPDGQYSPVPVPALARPAYRVPVTDPAFGTKITRITDAAAFGSSDERHGYSLRPPWNFDQTKIMLDGISNASIWILDASTYAILRTIPRFPDIRWSSVDPNKIFAVSGNRFISINATTGVQTTLHTFAGYSELTIGKAKGNLSIGDRYVALIGDLQAVIVYDVLTDTVIATRTFTQLGSSPAAFQWASMSQSGNYVVFAGGASASYDRNFTKIATLTPAHLPHGDIAYDTSGNEVYASICPPSMQRLSNGAKTALLNVTECGHISARNYKRPGWAYMNFAAGRPSDVIAVKLDGSKTVERFAHHRGTQATYTAQTHSSVSPDGTKVMFASDWNGTSEINSYVVGLVTGGPQNLPPTVSITAPAPGATVSGATSVTAAAADPDGGVLGVQFKLDGANLGAEDTSAPYAVTWNTATSSQGSHTLTAVARDGGASITTSAGVSVTVNNTVAPVSVRYSLPLRTAQVGSIEPTVGPNPVLRLCGGTPPATASEPDGGVELVKMQLPPDWATTAVSGIIQKLGTWEGTAKFSGLPTHFRIYAADGTTSHIQGSVTGSFGGGVITLGSMPLVTGQINRINTFKITAGNAGLVAPSAPNRLQFSMAVQNASLDRVQAIVGPSPVLKLITGGVPASIDISDPGSVVATMTLPPVWLTPASGGVAQQIGVWADPSADLTGFPEHAAFFDSTGTIRHIQVNVTGPQGGGVLQLANPNVVAGGNVPVTGFSIQAANQ